MAGEVRIITHNANGISGDAVTLQELLQRKGVDIAFVCETRLPQYFTWRNPGYRTYNIQGPNPPHGGTAIIIRSTIQHVVIPVPQLKSLQATLVRTKIGSQEVLLGALYQSPSKLPDLADLDKLIALAPNKKFIFGGDLNAKHTDWHSRLITKRGKTLARHAQDNNYSISGPDLPTCFPRKGTQPDVLDIIHRYP